MTARYAIYLAPQPDTALWRFGSRVLGYDAAGGRDLPGFSAAGHDVQAWARLTDRPRTYGFHATLKAPFRLAGETSVALPSFRQALSTFAAQQQSFDLGPLQVVAMAQGTHGFVALTLRRPSPELSALEREAVAVFDEFRAPARPEEIARRNPAELSARQRENLERWGYPYVGDDFHFHMTLTGALTRSHDVADALADLYAQEVGSAHMVVDALVLYEQPAGEARFRIADRFAFDGSHHIGRLVTSFEMPNP